MNKLETIFLATTYVTCPKCNTIYKKEDLFNNINDEPECSVCRYHAKFTDGETWLLKKFE